jgi:hypothetical protein
MSFAIKSYCLFSSFVIFTNLGFSQLKSDLGLIYSTDINNRISLEYRKPLANASRIKFGAFYGAYSSLDYRPNIISSTDTSVTLEDYSKNVENYGLRIGVDKAFNESPFSFGSDLNIAYRGIQQQFISYDNVLNKDTIYVNSPIYVQDRFNSISNSIKQHFLAVHLRFSLMLDVPLGDAFLINFNMAANLGVPIYMGASQVIDPGNKFIGTPPLTIDFTSGFGIGLRYLIGSKVANPIRNKVD